MSGWTPRPMPSRTFLPPSWKYRRRSWAVLPMGFEQPAMRAADQMHKKCDSVLCAPSSSHRAMYFQCLGRHSSHSVVHRGHRFFRHVSSPTSLCKCPAYGEAAGTLFSSVFALRRRWPRHAFVDSQSALRAWRSCMLPRRPTARVKILDAQCSHDIDRV